MNEQEMMRKHQKRKDRIKNTAILFLTVMLLLTFFSNTIMNYSLAEVSSAYASSGTLTTKIRGDGFVEAKDPVQVKTDKTSEVLKVYVKNGDKVKKGQTMFVLEGTAVSELKQAQSDLLTLNYEYEKALLEMQVPDYGKNNLDIKYAKKDLKDALQAIEDTKKEIKEKEAEYKKLKDLADAAKKKMEKKADAAADKALEASEIEMKLEEYTNEKEALDAETNEDIEAKEAALTNAKRVAEDAQTAYDEAEQGGRTSEEIAADIKKAKKTIASLQKEIVSLRSSLTEAEGGGGETAQSIRSQIEDLNADIFSSSTQISALESSISDLKKQYSEAKTEEEKKELSSKIETRQAELDTLKVSQQNNYTSLGKLQNQLKKAIEDDKKTITASLSAKEDEYNSTNEELQELEKEKASADTKEYNLSIAKAALKTATTAQKAAERALEDAKAALQKENAGERKALETKIKETKAEKITVDSQKQKLDTAYTDAQTAYNNAKAEADSFQKADETALDTVNQAAEEKRKALESLYLDLASTKSDDYLKQQLSDLDSSQKKEQIEQKKKEIAKLKKKKKPVRIKAKQAGIVGNVSIKAGDTTAPETALAEIQLKKNGFQLSIPVTMDQSKQVKRGDHASILNIWDDDVKAVLSEIKTDAQNPNAGRTLVFDVSGNVENGTSLSIAVGERTANYDLIVPTSAIREDSDGKFVLIIEEKPSPVGNRYIARKESVSVITQDETQTAITGGFDSYTSVITTSSKAVEPGDYVRLSA